LQSAAYIFLIMVLGPLIGSLIGVLKRPSFGYVCNMLCFAAGVMLTISFVELIPESIELSSVVICVSGLVFDISASDKALDCFLTQ
jgi:zinc transporter, ZIP family